MIRVYADFNCQDEEDRIILNCIGSLEDIEQHKTLLFEGMKVTLYMPGEFEVVGTLVFDRVWHGIPDWDTLRYLDEGTEDADSAAVKPTG